MVGDERGAQWFALVEVKILKLLVLLFLCNLRKTDSG